MVEVDGADVDAGMVLVCGADVVDLAVVSVVEVEGAATAVVEPTVAATVVAVLIGAVVACSVVDSRG